MCRQVACAFRGVFADRFERRRRVECVISTTPAHSVRAYRGIFTNSSGDALRATAFARCLYKASRAKRSAIRVGTDRAGAIAPAHPDAEWFVVIRRLRHGCGPKPRSRRRHLSRACQVAALEPYLPRRSRAHGEAPKRPSRCPDSPSDYRYRPARLIRSSHSAAFAPEPLIPAGGARKPTMRPYIDTRAGVADSAFVGFATCIAYATF